MSDSPNDVDAESFDSAALPQNDEVTNGSNEDQELNYETVEAIAEDGANTEVDEFDDYQASETIADKSGNDSKTVSVTTKENNFGDFDGYMEKDELSDYLARLPLNVPLHVSVKARDKDTIITISIKNKD